MFYYQKWSLCNLNAHDTAIIYRRGFQNQSRKIKFTVLVEECIHKKENTFQSFLIYIYKIKLFIFPARSNALYAPFSARRRSLRTRFVSIHWKSSSTTNNICTTIAQAFESQLEFRNFVYLYFRLGYLFMTLVLFLI